jgi:hypothetical protein
MKKAPAQRTWRACSLPSMPDETQATNSAGRILQPMRTYFGRYGRNTVTYYPFTDKPPIAESPERKKEGRKADIPLAAPRRVGSY